MDSQIDPMDKNSEQWKGSKAREGLEATLKLLRKELAQKVAEEKSQRLFPLYFYEARPPLQ